MLLILKYDLCYNPPAKYIIGQLVNLLANGLLFIYRSTHSQITLNTTYDLSKNTQVLPYKAGQYVLKI